MTWLGTLPFMGQHLTKCMFNIKQKVIIPIDFTITCHYLETFHMVHPSNIYYFTYLFVACSQITKKMTLPE